MSKFSKSGLQTLGSLAAGSAVAVWAGYFIYALQDPNVDVNSKVTWILGGVALIGIAIALCGARVEPDQDLPAVSMRQRGGHKSRNIQSGRDTIINSSKDRDVQP
jgi:hypothetical protein